MIHLEYWMDSNTILEGSGEWMKVKTDDEFGAQLREEFEWKSFSVTVAINDTGHNVTAAISQRTIDEWKELLLEKGEQV